MAIKGECLCGKVSYTVTGSLLDADHCHCSMCRRQHGAAFATYAQFKSGDFTWITGENLLKVYESSSGCGWCFCSECGSTMAGTENGIVTTITLGTVEGDAGIKPTSHIFAGSKARWYDIKDNLPQFEMRSQNLKIPTEKE